MQDRRNAAIRALIEQGLEENEAERDQLNKALVNMGMGMMLEVGSPVQPGPKRRRARRAAKGQRQAQFLGAVKEKPGITVAEIAKKLGVSPPNALYTLAKRLVKQGKVVKSGAGYELKGAAPRAAPRKAAAKRSASKKAKSGKPKKG
jgi:transposase-like protein